LFKGFAPMHKVLANKYYIDELYNAAVVIPLRKISAFSSNIIDRLVVDGAVNGLGRGVRWVSSGLRVLQTGDLQTYGIMMLGGVLLAMFFIFKVFI
jgi:NADH-quinone oxidoreductase subunit L